MSQKRLDDGPFNAVIEGFELGNICITKFSLQNLQASTTHQTIRHHNNKTDQLFLSLVVRGSVSAIQNDCSATTRAGDFSVRDTNTPWVIQHADHSEVIAIGIPRYRLESVLGSASHFAGLTIDGHLPVTTLARSFIINLVRIGDQLEPRAAERMVDVGIDLVTASIAERMAMETPKNLRSTLLIQRAVAYIKSHIGDADLSPAQVAAELGVSLRHLQILFREDGRNIAAWIWQQRVERAARCLNESVYSRVPLKKIAHDCGFADQAHFSRRFRDHFGLSPRDYRDAKISH